MHRLAQIAVIMALTCLATGYSAATAEQSSPDTQKAAIRSLMAESAAAWNRGDLDGFMATYWKSPKLRFASGATVHRGWKATFERYRNRYGSDQQGMGRLAFEDLEITPLGRDAAVVFGRYRLTRGDDEDSEGLFTLTVRKMDEKWLIVQDHTSTGREP